MPKKVTNEQLRSFGLLVGGAFAIVGLAPVVLRGQTPRLWALFVLCLLALPAPKVLKPVYRGWMTIGYMLGWVNTRIILGLIYYLVFAPLGLSMRLFGKDSMRRRFEPSAESYRVVKQQRPSSHMKQQF